MKADKSKYLFCIKVNTSTRISFSNDFVTQKYLNDRFIIFFIPGNVLPNFQSIENLDSFSICVKLTGGNGDCAWQHTQLFRQSISAIDEFPLELNITFY